MYRRLNGWRTKNVRKVAFIEHQIPFILKAQPSKLKSKCFSIEHDKILLLLLFASVDWHEGDGYPYPQLCNAIPLIHSANIFIQSM